MNTFVVMNMYPGSSIPNLDCCSQARIQFGEGSIGHGD